MSKEVLKALGVDDLEKSFNDSLENMKGLLGDPIEKAKKGGAEKPAALKEEKDEDDEGGEEEEEEEEGEEKGGGKKPTMKSLNDFVSSEDPEAGAAMDIEPFLKALVKGIDEKFTAMEATLQTMQKGIKTVMTLNKAQAQFMVNAAEMQKAMAETVEKIGETPVPSKSVLRKSGDRFDETSEKGDISDMSRGDILDKALKLKAAGKFNELDVTKIEGRLNKGIALEDRHVALIKSA